MDPEKGRLSVANEPDRPERERKDRESRFYRPCKGLYLLKTEQYLKMSK